ncbi:myb/SANT-like DNA-binding domain-containing protein 3 [Lineus longissimus]|uniref:myb/SANT-like DNA-binding domain-containing protein 3 n=1 Tax=Lineus longissimus TaxID=88925 RepID=UPI002B4D71EF
MADQTPSTMSKKRSKPYSKVEKAVLLELIDDYKDIIENKKHDSKVSKKKELAWDSVTRKYNSEPNVHHRDKAQLKTFWKNVKMRAKKDIAEEKRERMATGGGKDPSTVDSMRERVSSMIPSQIRPLLNPFDDDVEMEDDDNFDIPERVENSSTSSHPSSHSLQTLSLQSGTTGGKAASRISSSDSPATQRTLPSAAFGSAKSLLQSSDALSATSSRVSNSTACNYNRRNNREATVTDDACTSEIR